MSILMRSIRLYFKPAWRNLLRNRRRTVITLVAIAFGYAALVINGGIIHNIFWGLREDAVRTRYGHLQIYKSGYLAKGMVSPWEYTILMKDYQGKIAPLLASLQDLDRMTIRLEFSGLINHREANIGFIGLGVEPDQDMAFSTFQAAGKFGYQTWKRAVMEGEPLSNGEPTGVVLGKGLAEGIGVEVGDYLTLMATTKEGFFNALDTRVRGIFATGMKEYDDRVMKIPIQTAWEFLNLDGFHSIVLMLDKTEQTEQVRDRLARIFDQQGWKLELRTWKELALFHNQVVSLFNREMTVVEIIISIIVILSITNTMGMSIFERTKEIGTMRAMGAKVRHLLLMFLLEGLTLGVIGGILGLIGGVGLALVISFFGIPFPSPPGSTMPYIAKVDIVPSLLAFAFLLCIVTSVVATFLPAYRASRLEIVDALRSH